MQVQPSAVFNYILNVGLQERRWPIEDREQEKIPSLGRY